MRVVQHGMYQLYEFAKFLSRSTNQHGVHSPFVYDLVTKGIYKGDISGLRPLLLLRAQLLQDHSLIAVGHIGEGSKINNASTRKVSDLVRHSGISRRKAILLYSLVRYCQPKSILELGTSLGMSTACMALAAPDAQIHAVDGASYVLEAAKKNWHQLNLGHIVAFNQYFDYFLQGQDLFPYDCILFDGDHNRTATLRYFEQLLPMHHNDSVWIFDDIHWSKGMREAWTEIKNHPDVRVTIDFFHYGVVFFKDELSKENFVIRS